MLVFSKATKKWFYLVNAKQNIKPKISNDDEFVTAVTNEFNDSIVFDPDQLRMAYTIRDPIINSKQFFVYSMQQEQQEKRKIKFI